MGKWAERSFFVSIGALFSGLCVAAFGQLGLQYDYPGAILPETVSQEQLAKFYIERGELIMILASLSAFSAPLVIHALGNSFVNDLKSHD